ncbi:MAG: hypothetical protein KF724_02335 [Phycisphaeraceae bacterium]|nr:hypothetical protein [Phycisphaeraceae bacterium]
MRFPTRINLPSRERMLAGLGPTLLALLVLALFVIPNYFAAAEARRESRRVDQVTNEHLMKRSQLVALERDLARLRAERDLRCRIIGDLASDRLVDAIARPVDGRSVRNQGIRLGMPEKLAKEQGRPLDLTRRVVTVEMSGSFEAIFSVLDAADRIDQLVVPVRLELGAIRGGTTDEISVRATLELHSFFRAQEASR